MPGTIAVVGDLGDMVLRVNHSRPLRWALGSRFRPEEPYYPMTKLSRFTKNEMFMVEDATDYLAERIQEARRDGSREWAKSYISAMREWKSYPFLDQPREAEHKWGDLMYELGDDDPPSCRDHTTGTYFRYQALCWFMQHVNPDDPRFAEELAP